MFNNNVTNTLGNILRNKYNTNIVSFDQLPKQSLNHTVSSIFVHNQKVLLSLSIAFANTCKQETGYSRSISNYCN